MRKVLINALPKAGTNLLAKCLTMLGYREEGGLGSFLASPTSFKGRVRRLLWSASGNPYRVGIDMPMEIPKYAVDRILKRVGESRFVSAHVGYDDQILLKAISMKFVSLLIVRDPRAVLASFVPYVITNNLHPLNGAFRAMPPEDCYWVALRGGEFGSVRLKSLASRCEALRPWMANNAVINIRFEDIIGSKGGGSDELQLLTLKRVCNAIGRPENQAIEVAENLFGPGRSTFRKGQIDSWRGEIPQAVILETERELASVLEWWGYD